MWLDANKCNDQGPRGAWLSFKITNNTASTLNNVVVTFAGFTGTNAAYFVAPHDLTRTFTSIAVGANVPVYYYVDYSDVCNHPHGGGTTLDGYTAQYTITVNSTGNASVVRNGTIITDELLTASAAGLALSAPISITSQYVGQIFTQTVTYSFGNNTDLFFQPNAEKDFPDECLRLIKDSISATTGSVTGLLGQTNSLAFPIASTNSTNNTVTVVYTWQVNCTSSSAVLHPWAAAKSGQKYKYSGFGSTSTITNATQAISISKSVNPDFLATPTSNGGFGAGIAQWTVLLSNSSSSTILVNKIIDVIPSCMTISNVSATGSQITSGNSFSLPTVGSTGTQSWVGIVPVNIADWQYKVPPNGTVQLVYQTNVSSCATQTIYTNSATALVGTTTVGPATASITIGCIAPTISYNGTPFCKTGIATVTRIGLSGGTYTSTSGLSINSSTGEIDLSASTPGTYTITYTLTSPCSFSTTTNIVINPLPTLSTSQVNVQCYGNSTGSIDLSVTGGTSPYTYLWSNSATTQDIGGLAAGTYSVSVTDNKGCIKTTSIVITEPAAALTSSLASQTNVLCFGNSTGAIDIHVTGGTSAYSYVWTKNGSAFAPTTQDLTGLTAGVYAVSITDANGCTASRSITITQPTAALSTSISSQTNVLCFGASTGAVTVTATGGTSPYQFQLGSGSFQSSGTFTGLTAGSYTVTVKDANNCTAPKTIIITQPSALIASIGSQTNVLCFGNSTGAVTVTTSGGTAPYQFQLGSGSFQSSGTFTGLAAGSYVITVKDANNCTTTQEVIITQPVSALITSISSQTNVACFSGSTGDVTVSATGGTSPYQFQLGSGSFQSSGTFTGLTAGSYTVTVKDANNCTAPQAVVITQPAAALAVTLNSQTNVNCFGETTGAIDINVTGGTATYTYVWTINGGAFAPVTQDLTGLSSGVYFVTVTDSYGCTATLSVTITQPANALSVVCSGVSPTGFATNDGSASVVASGGTSAYSYLWSNNATTSTITGLTSGTYSVVVTDFKGCTATCTSTLNNPLADLAIVKTVNNSTPNVGSTIIFTLNATNNGPSAATGVSVSDLLPSGYTYVSSSTISGTYTSGTGVWAIGAMANSGTASLTITATVNATGTYANTATITGNQTDPTPGNNTSTNTPVPVPQTDLAIVKTVNNSTPNVGTTVIFTLNAINNGPSAATGVSVSDLLPSGYTYVSSSTLNGTYTSGTGIWAIGNLANSGTASLTISATVNATGIYVNTSTITGIENDPILTNNSSSVTPSTNPVADLSVVKTVNNSTPNVGSNVTFTLTVANNGPSAANLVSVSDLLPSGYVYVSSSTVTGTYTSGTGVWAIGSMPNSGTASLSITATVISTGTYTNTAVISGLETDPVLTNNTSSLTPVVNDLPIANKDVVSTNEDTPLSGTVATNDHLSNDGGNVFNIACVLCSSPAHGSLTFNSNGTYTYTPTANYNGPDQFIYQLCDVNGDCDTAIVLINVISVNDVPVAVNDVNSTNEDTPVNGNASTNDTPSGDGGNVWSLVGTNGGAANGTVSMNPDGSYTYTPNANYNGTDVFTYEVCDALIPQKDCSTATVTVTINSVNDVPVAVNDVNSTNEDTPVNGNASTNDTPSGDGGNVWSLVGSNGGATNGTVSMNPDGSYTYTPNANYNGTDVFTYEVCDALIPQKDCSTATVTVTINSVNDVPVAVNDANSTNEDTPVNGNASTNDTPSGDGGNVWSLIGINGGATNGTVTMNPDGSYTYTPNANYNGTDVFTYEVCDALIPQKDCSTATVTVTINSVNDVPVAVNDVNSTNEDTPVNGNASTNDTPSGDGGNVWSLVGSNGGATNGTVSMNPDGSYTYTPNANYNGTDVFTYEVCDALIPQKDCSTATVTVTINSVNDVPVAVNDVNSTNEDTPVNGNASTNDTPSGDGGNVWSLVGSNGGATNGTVSMNPDGSYTYTPNANYNGTDVFTYEVCDALIPQKDCSTATVTVTINSVNDVPVAVNDVNSTNEDTPVNGNASSNDTPSGDGGNVWALVGINGGATNGTVTMNPNGTYTYTPNANYNGTDVFTYQVCDVTPDCSTATVTITINSVNDVPVAVNDLNSTNEDTPVNGNASSNDTPSGDGGNVWSLVGINGGASNGTVSMNPDGSYTYTPNANYNGTDVFTYQVCDATPDCSTATVTVTINSVNDVPVAVNDINSTNEDTPVNGNASTNDTPSGDGGNVWTLVGINGGATNGTVTMNTNGTYTYTPNANYNGTDVFTYQVCDATPDCSTATVTVTINSVNDVPVAVNDINSTNEDTPVNGNASTNDTPSGDGGNVWTLVGTNGGATNGTVTMNPNGSYTYTPNANYNGTDVFTYEVCDALIPQKDCSTATVTVTINSVNDVPVAVNDVNSSNEDTPVNGNASTNDTPSGDGGNVWTLVGINGGATNGTVSMNPDGSYTYTPNANYNGTDVFTYEVCDALISQKDCSTATVTVTINSVNDVPVAVNDINSTNEDTPVNGNASTNDTPSGDGGNVWTLVGTNGGATNGTVSMNPDGSYTYTPNANYNGTDVFTYEVCDATPDCSTATVTITINSVNDVPVAVNDVNSTNEDTPVNGNASSNDTPSGDGGNVWSLVGTNGGATNGTVTMNANGTYTYTPIANYNGTDVFTYEVCDATPDCSTATVTITITPVNDPPVAVHDAKTTNENVAVSGTVVSNDTDVDGNLNPTGFTLISGPTHGTLVFNANGTYTYTPALNYNGTDNFIYQACDLGMPVYCDTAIVRITVDPSTLVVNCSLITNVACAGGNTGSATVSVSGGIAPFTYLWSNSSTTQTISGLAVGNYSVIVTDATSTSKTCAVIITENPALVLACNMTNVSINGGSNGVANLNVSGGTPPYTHKWNTGGITATLNNMPAGIYTDTVTDALGCTAYLECSISQPSAGCNGFRTQTQGAWGQCHQNGNNPGTYLFANFAAAFPAGLTVGCTNTLKLTSAQAVCDFLPSGTTPRALPAGAMTNPAQTYKNVFAGQVVTLAINIRFDIYDLNFAVSTSYLNGLLINSGTFAGWTVQQLFDEANKKLGGCSSAYSYSELNDAVTRINENFDNGYVTGNYLSCSPPMVISCQVITNVGCAGGNTGSAIVNVSGGLAPITYSWSNGGGNTQVATGLGIGTYTVTVTDATNTQKTCSVNITGTASPVIAGIASQINILCGSANGSVTASATGGVGPYQYKLGSGTYQSSATFNGLSAGTYVITVKDDLGCTATVSVTITQSTAMILSSSHTNVSCYGSNNGSITVNVTGGTPGYQYKLGSGSYQTENEFTNLPGGTYIITVKDTNACTQTINVSVNQPSASMSTSLLSKTNIACNGSFTGTFTLNVTGGTAPYQYKLGFGSFQSSSTFTGLTAGFYIITIKDLNNCLTYYTVTIHQPEILTASVSAQTNISCTSAGMGSFCLTATGGTWPYTYKLDSASYSSDNCFTNLIGGTYHATLMDSNGCTASTSTLITQPIGGLTAVVTSKTNVSCFGLANGSFCVTASAGVAPYQYKLDNGAYGSSNCFTGLTPSCCYCVTVKDATGCTYVLRVSITSPAASLSATIGSQTNIGCTGGSTGSVTINATGGTLPYQYKLGSGVYQSSATFSSLAMGNYVITVMDSNGCTTVQSVSIIQSANNMSAFMISQVNVGSGGGAFGSVCIGADGGIAPYTYKIGSGSYQSSNCFTSLTPGTYLLTAKDASGCTAVTNVTITQCSAIITPIVDSIINVGCYGWSTGGVVMSGATGGLAPYQYKIGSNGYQTYPVLGSMPAGHYVVSVKDANGCVGVIGVTISQPAYPLNVSVGSHTDVACNGSNSGTVTVNATGGNAPYQYRIGNGSYQLSNIFNNLPAGFYMIGVVDATGCSVNTSVTINQPYQVLTAVVTSMNSTSTLISTDGEATIGTIGGTAPFQYKIGNGAYQSSNTFSNLAYGTYTVTVLDFRGCTATVTFSMIPCSNPLTAIVLSKTDVQCYGWANGSITMSVSGGTGPYEYKIAGGNWQSYNVLSGLAAGTYLAMVRAQSGCAGAVYVTISQPAMTLTANILSQTNVQCNGTSTGAFTITGMGGTAPYQYSINYSSFTSNGNFTNLVAGSYMVTIKDANGCMYNQGVNIFQPYKALTATIGGITNVNTIGGNTGGVTIAVDGGTAPYQYKIGSGTYQSSNTFGTLSVGTYTVTVLDANGCTTIINVNIIYSVNTVVVNVLSKTNINCYGSATGSICVIATGGNAPYQYRLSTGWYQASNCFTGLSSGTHIIIAKDAAGNESSLPVTLTQPANAIVTSLASKTDVSCYGSNNGSLCINATGGTYPYQYKDGNGVYQISRCFTGLTAGMHVITVKDSLGCTATQLVNITQPASGVTASILSVTNVPTPGTSTGGFTVGATGGSSPYMYKFGNGSYAWNATFTGLPVGCYTVTAKDANGCTDMVTVTVNNAGSGLVVSVNAQNNSSCSGAYSGAMAIKVEGGMWPYKYKLDRGEYQSGNTFNQLAPGTYRVSVTDGENQKSTQTVVIGDAQPLTNNLIATNVSATTFGSVQHTLYLGLGTQKLAIEAKATGNGQLMYNWSGTYLSGKQSSHVIFEPKEAGNYTLSCEVTNEFGCQTTTTLNVCVMDIKDLSSGNADPKVWVCNNGTSTSVSTKDLSNYFEANPNAIPGACNTTCDGKPSNNTDVTSKVGVEMNVYPNPTASDFTISGITSKEAKLMVYDFNGKEVMLDKTFVNDHEIKFGNEFANGFYTLVVYDGGISQTFKLSKVY